MLPRVRQTLGKRARLPEHRRRHRRNAELVRPGEIVIDQREQRCVAVLLEPPLDEVRATGSIDGHVRDAHAFCRGSGAVGCRSASHRVCWSESFWLAVRWRWCRCRRCGDRSATKNGRSVRGSRTSTTSGPTNLRTAQRGTDCPRARRHVRTSKEVSTTGRSQAWRSGRATNHRADDSSVAIGIASSRPVGTIALEECDRRVAGAVQRSRTAEFGRIRASGRASAGARLRGKGRSTASRPRDPDVAEGVAHPAQTSGALRGPRARP